VRAEVIRGEITRIYSIPTASQVYIGNRLDVAKGTASIRSEPDISRDPTSCLFKVDSEIGQRVFDACFEALTSEPATAAGYRAPSSIGDRRIANLSMY
jgi:hypothetical protein